MIRKKKPNKGIAKSARTYKGDLIEDAIHELRTPLAIIKGNSDLALREGNMSPDLRLAFSNINHEVGRLSGRFSELAGFVHSKKNAKAKNFKIVDVSKIISRLVKRFVALTKSRNIKITTRGRSAKIRGSEKELEKLFSNLILNAINYGKRGGKILIEFVKRGKYLNIIISDQGIGIPAKNLPFVFNRFYQVHKTKKKSYSGSGIGLALVKSIAEDHKGGVYAESTLGKGSVFTVALPIA